MTTPNIEELIAELRYVAKLAEHYLDKAKIVNDAADALDIQAGSIEAVQTVNARQAERIKEQARLLEVSVPMDDHIAALVERDAQLAEIENVEPVIWAISYDGVAPYTLWHEGDVIYREIAKLRDGIAAAPAPQAQEPACPECGASLLYECVACSYTNYPKKQDMKPQAQPATSDEWLANCPQEVRDFANKLKAAPQPAHTNEDAARFKARHQFLEWNRQQDEALVKIAYEYCVFEKAIELYKEALQSAQPVAQPNIQNQIVKDISRHEPCHACAHYQQGKRTGVSIHDETCYGCSEYYANKWEAA